MSNTLNCPHAATTTTPAPAQTRTAGKTLNSITTLAELYIGFLVAAASNRLERRNHAQMQRLDLMEQQMVRMEREHGEQLAELVTINREQRRILHELREQATASVRDAKTGRYVSRQKKAS